MKYSLGVDIGGTKCAVLLGSADTRDKTEILYKQAFATGHGPEQTINMIFSEIDRCLSERGVHTEQIAGIGISCGGPLDAKRGIIMNPPNLSGWDNIPIADILEDRYGVRARLDNDANACAVAEWKYGAAKGCSDIIFLTFGTGLGAGLILNGRLYTGANGMAGEAGHMRLRDFGPVGYGKSGSFEGFCSGGGIAQLARQKALERLQRGESPSICPSAETLPEITAKSVADAADNGDELAKEIYEISGEYLGLGLSILVDVINPEIVVIGSIFYRSEHLLRPAMERVLRRESLPLSREACRIVPAGLGESIGDYAALSLALLSD